MKRVKQSQAKWDFNGYTEILVRIQLLAYIFRPHVQALIIQKGKKKRLTGKLTNLQIF